MQVFLISYVFSILMATGVCLQCEQCTSSSSSCTGLPQLCGKNENACLILTTEITLGKEKWLATFKGCTKAKYCMPSPMSSTYPSQRRRSASMCCRKDLCNSGAVTMPRLGVIPNGLKCPGCYSEDPRCPPTELLTCNGWENNCVYYDVSIEQNGKIYHQARRGCGTKHACMNKPQIFGVPGMYMEIVKTAQCTPAPKLLTKSNK